MKLKMCTIVTGIVALVVAIMSVLPDQNSQLYAAYVTHFLMSLIPVIGIAALWKYLTHCGEKKSCCEGSGKCCSPQGACQDKSSCCN